MQFGGPCADTDGRDNRDEATPGSAGHTEHVQTHLHGIAWLMCQRLGDDFDNDSLFSVTWCDVLEQNYFDGHQLR